MQVQGIYTPTTAVSSPPGTVNTLVQGKSSELVMSELHGKYYYSTIGGNTFFGSSLAAGVAIPFVATTQAAKFVLWNPAGSGINVELIDFAMGIDSATVIVNGICLMFQSSLSTGAGVPTALTAAAAGTTSGLIGLGGTPKAGLYSAATLTNTAIGPLYMMFAAQATATTGFNPLLCNFDGKIVLRPDSLVSVSTTVTGGQTAAPCSFTWAEFPV